MRNVLAQKKPTIYSTNPAENRLNGIAAELRLHSIKEIQSQRNPVFHRQFACACLLFFISYFCVFVWKWCDDMCKVQYGRRNSVHSNDEYVRDRRRPYWVRIFPHCISINRSGTIHTIDYTVHTTSNS